MIRHHKTFLEPLGMTFPRYLVVLALLDDAPLPVGALGSRLDMDPGPITPLVKRLEVIGMVTRTRGIADERRVFVELTAHGRTLESQIRGITDHIRSACQLTDKGIDDLRHTLEVLARP